MPIVGPPVDITAVDAFCEYFRSLKLLNYVQSLLPRYFLKTDALVNIQELERREFMDRASGTGIDLGEYEALLSDYLDDRASEPTAKFHWRNFDKAQLTPRKPNPLQQFVLGHVGNLYKGLEKIPSGIEKSWSAVRGVVKSGFTGYSDEIYEAFSLLSNEVSKQDVQKVIAIWQRQREQFQKSLQYPSSITPPKMFWPTSSIRYVDECVARYRFKCEFEVGAFESAFVEFEESLAESLNNSIAGEVTRHLAYDLCMIGRSRDLAIKLRSSVTRALDVLMSGQAQPYWTEWSPDANKTPRKVPSVATTSFAALALLKLGSSDLARNRGRDAAAWLLENQNPDGSWSLDNDGDSHLALKPDVHVTLTTMEGIARSGIPGTSHHLDLARDWVLSKQDKNGLWEDEAFSLPEPTILVIETFDYLDKLVARTTDTYLAAAIGYLKRGAVLLEERDTTAQRLAVVTAHLGIESLLYSIIQTKNITKFIDKGQTIGMRAALSAFQNWMQQQRHLKPSEILSYSNELGKLAHLRDEIVHKALSIGIEDARSVVEPAARFSSKYSLLVLGFDCMD